MKSLLLLTGWICIFHHKLPAQSKMLLENYYYNSERGTNAIMPMFHLKTNNNWYAEIRYNYEDVNTVSLYAGKTFAKEGDVTYSLTPLLGYSAGRFRGASFAVNAETEWRQFFISSQSQYSRSLKSKDESFFFTWSEAGYCISENFFSGLALQYTKLSYQDIFEPGFLAGVSIKNVSFPCYLFNPFQHERYFILGLNYEFSLKKKKPDQQ
jgi:hypothetical protein